MTVASTGAQAAELGLLNADVTLTADLLTQVCDGLAEIGTASQGIAQVDVGDATRRRLYSVPPLPSD